jgi:hypothetical protein
MYGFWKVGKMKENWEELFDKKFVFDHDNGPNTTMMMFTNHPNGLMQITRPEHLKDFIRSLLDQGGVIKTK